MTRISAQLGPYRERIYGWWAHRSIRERALLSIMIALVAAVGLVWLVIRPLQAARATAIANIRTYELLTVRLRASGPVAPSTSRRTGDATAIVQSSASQFGLVARSVTANGTTVRVQMAAVPYEAVIRWIADLDQTSSLRASEISLQPAVAAGRVNADVMFIS